MMETNSRYWMHRVGSLLKCSLSRKRSSRLQLMGKRSSKYHSVCVTRHIRSTAGRCGEVSWRFRRSADSIASSFLTILRPVTRDCYN